MQLMSEGRRSCTMRRLRDTGELPYCSSRTAETSARQSQTGWTALHHAVANGGERWKKQLAVLELILERGADPNVADNRDCTPLHYALVLDSRVTVGCFCSREVTSAHNSG